MNLVHAMLAWYFTLIDRNELLGVSLLTTIESSLGIIPSEIVVPPAAYLASQEAHGAVFMVLGVVVASTIGACLGATALYWLARALGRPLLLRYGRVVFVTEHKLHLAEQWVARYGPIGIFMARLLPVARHFMSIPAGLTGMPFRSFITMTFAGSMIWNSVLTISGVWMAHDMAVLIQSGGANTSAALQHAIRNLTIVALGLATLVTVLFFIGRHFAPKPASDGGKRAEGSSIP